MTKEEYCERMGINVGDCDDEMLLNAGMVR